VIFARGFNEEVVATAAINIQRQTASVIPIVVPFDEVVSKLSLRLKDCSDAQASLIRGRINALGSGVVTIKVGSDKRAIVGIQRDRIDFGLRYAKSCLAGGAIEYQGILIPYSSFKSGIKSADSFSSLLAGCGAILEVDRCG